MRVFIGGVMQASIQGKGIVSQDYRRQIADALWARWPEIEVIDPFAQHPNSVEYDDAEAEATLTASLASAASADLVIAYVPVASMGTALEMYAAHQAGVPVVTISPLAENWVVRAYSRRVFPDVESFLAAVQTAGSPEDFRR
jgi:prephenate dehydrogenase